MDSMKRLSLLSVLSISLWIMSVTFSPAFSEASEKYNGVYQSCKNYWETMALDSNNDDNQIATMAANLYIFRSKVNVQTSASFIRTITKEIFTIQKKIAVVCEGFQDDNKVNSALLTEFFSTAPLVQKFVAKVEERIIEDINKIISTYEIKLSAGKLPEEELQKYQTFKSQSVEFLDFWVMAEKAWQNVQDDMLRTKRVLKDPQSDDLDSISCPSGSCSLEKNFCYNADEGKIRVFYNNHLYLWLANIPLDHEADASHGGPAKIAILDEGAGKILHVPINELRLTGETPKECQIQDVELLKTYQGLLNSLKFPNPDLPHSPSEDTTGRRTDDQQVNPRMPAPDQKNDTTMDPFNDPGANCSGNYPLEHNEIRWYDLALNQRGVVPGQQKIHCRNGVTEIVEVLCIKGHRKKSNNTCAEDDYAPEPTEHGKACEFLALRDGESKWFDFLHGGKNIIGKIMRRCEDGVANIRGVMCKVGSLKKGNFCILQSTTPPRTTGCSQYGMDEGASRILPLHPDATSGGKSPGAWMEQCNNGKLSSQLVCNSGWQVKDKTCIPGDSSDPTKFPNVPSVGGLPGSSGPSVSSNGKVVGAISQIISDLLDKFHDLIMAKTNNPNNPIYNPSAQCLMINGQCILTSGGNTVICNDQGILIEKITGQFITIGKNQIKVIKDRLVDALTNKRLSGGIFLLGNTALRDMYGKKISLTFKDLPLQLKTPPGTKPREKGAPQNLKIADPKHPLDFENPSWVKSLCNPGTGTSRPDGTNIPGRLGSGGTAYKTCMDDGIVRRHGDKWKVPIDGGEKQYNCFDGQEHYLVACFKYHTLNGERCMKWCEHKNRHYQHNMTHRLRIPSNTGTHGAFCFDGRWEMYNDIICDRGYVLQGGRCIRVYRDCPQDGLYHGQVRNQNIEGGYIVMRCNDGFVFRMGFCQSGYIWNGFLCQELEGGEYY